MKRLMVVTLAAVGCLTSASVFAAEGADLAKSKNCFTCHAVDKKLVGPSYKDVAAKYAGQKDAAATLAVKMRKGGVGVWGQVPMPPNPLVNEEDSKKLAEWVLSHK